VDGLIPVVRELELAGRVYITVPGRLPPSAGWRDDVARTLRKHISAGSGEAVMVGGEKIDWSLQAADGSLVSGPELRRKTISEKGPYAHVAVFGSNVNDRVRDPVIFRLESAKEDAFLESVLESLKDAEEQFTGTRAAIIFCFLPEIESFNDLRSDSAITKMTDFFFGNHARNCINAVCYVSEAGRAVGEAGVQAHLPAVTFRNHNYDPGYGADIPVYA
jgi:hypothetical protein